MSTQWDDPEQYPEDEEAGMAPGDEPQTGEGWDIDVVNDSQPSPNWDESTAAELRRARRRQRVNDYLLTREYRERRKHELREERGGRFA